MRYTIRLTIQVRNSRRQIREFVRPEHATNTSSHATRFDSFEEAQRASDVARHNFETAGHTYIGTDFYEVA